MGILRKSLLNSSFSFEKELPEKPIKLESSAQKIKFLLGMVNPRKPNAYDLNESYEIILNQINDGKRADSIERVHFKRSPWVIFEAKNSALAIALHDEFMESYFIRISEEKSPSIIFSLANAFIFFYPHQFKNFDYIRASIKSLLAELTNNRGKLFKERSEQFGFFDEKGCSLFAKQMLEYKAPGEFIELSGLTGSLEKGQFVEESSKELLNEVAHLLAEGNINKQELIAVLAFYIEGNQFRYPHLRHLIADALLLPFATSSLSNALKPFIQEFLLNHYDDPRLKLDCWLNVSESGIDVMKRWLINTTLEDFFRIVSEHAKKDSAADRQWPFRRAFWSSYLHDGYITDAWVVLGEEIAFNAREALQGQADKYGRLQKGDGAKRNHAVLILRIGDLVITEWNHVGKYRVWNTTNLHAPKFYKKSYQRKVLVNHAELENSHSGAANGTWQHKLATHIHESAGIYMPYNSYMYKNE